MSATATLPALDGRYALNDAQIEQFRADGFIKLKNVLSPEEIDAFAPIITELTFEHDPNKGIALDDKSTYDRAFIQVSNMWEMDERARAFAFSERMARIATELLGVTGVRMWHDQALYKEPGGGFTPWHVDQYYWPMATMQSVTAWIPLQETPMDMGPLAFGKASHLLPAGREIAISDESEAKIAAHVEKHGVEHVYEPFDLGEVSFHYGFTLHRAGPNTTDSPRKVFTVIYMDEDQRLIAPRNANHQQDWDHWTPGSVPGEVMDSPKNPVLYSTRG
ncbi:MAG: phytanoyl-CoA dioxygenase family protein [Planctomycetota bacterium]